MTEPDYRSLGHISVSGCIVEWRLKPDAVVLSNLLHHDDVGPDWSQSNYQIDMLAYLPNGVPNRVIRPYISSETCDELAQYNLVSELVAEAILACLKTATQPCLLPYIEWRIVHVRLEVEHKIFEEDSDG